MKNMQLLRRPLLLMLVLFAMPTLAFAHDPDGWGVAAVVSLPITIVLGYILIRLGLKIGRRFTLNTSKTMNIVVSISVVVSGVLLSIFCFPLIFGAVYWIYDTFIR